MNPLQQNSDATLKHKLFVLLTVLQTGKVTVCKSSKNNQRTKLS